MAAQYLCDDTRNGAQTATAALPRKTPIISRNESASILTVGCAWTKRDNGPDATSMTPTAMTTCTGKEAPSPAATAAATAPPANMMKTKSTVAASMAASTSATPIQNNQTLPVSQSIVRPPFRGESPHRRVPGAGGSLCA